MMIRYSGLLFLGHPVYVSAPGENQLCWGWSFLVECWWLCLCVQELNCTE